jgi:hypothetical protein
MAKRTFFRIFLHQKELLLGRVMPQANNLRIIPASEERLMTEYSPHYNSLNCPPLDQWSPELRIAVFEDRVNGWMLSVARQLAQNSGSSGCAVLSIILSYFEMIALYERGNKAQRSSRHKFYAGLESVARHNAWPGEDLPRLRSQLYRGLRCSLYHEGMISPHAIVTSESLKNEAYEFREGRLVVNPVEMVNAVQNHFTAYIERLRSSDRLDEFTAQFTRSFVQPARYPGVRGLWQLCQCWARHLLRLSTPFRSHE